MNLKLSSAKRVETEVHHLSAYHLPCSCAFKPCSVLAVMQSQLIFCLFLCCSVSQSAGRLQQEVYDLDKSLSCSVVRKMGRLQQDVYDLDKSLSNP